MIVFHGLKAEFVGEAVRKVLMGQCQLVFITPEVLIDNSRFCNMLLSTTYKEKLVALVIDEAHCVKTWGDKFRVAFGKIKDKQSLLPDGVHIIAVTATSTNETFHIISECLCMKSPEVIALSPAQDNILYKVQPKVSLEDLTSQKCVRRELDSPRLWFL